MINFNRFPQPFNPTWKEILIALAIVAGILILSFADNFSDNPEVNPQPVYVLKTYHTEEDASKWKLPTPDHVCTKELTEGYQLTVDINGNAEVFNCCRYVGRYKMDFDNPKGIDSLILADNL